MKCKECNGTGWRYSSQGVGQGRCPKCNGTGQDNKEYCEWENIGTIEIRHFENCRELAHVTSTDNYNNYKYCPYCGKEIRVQELER